MGRMVNELSDKGFRAIAVLYNILKLSEYIVEDFECEDVYIDIYRYGSEIKDVDLYCVGCLYTSNNDLNSHIEYIKDLFKIDIDIEFRRASTPMYGKGFRDLYKDIANLIKRRSIDHLKYYAHLTNNTQGLEYLLLFLANGKGVLLEGEEHKVEIPYIKNVIASIHTHPKGYCLPSRQDIETCIIYMGDGSLLCGIVTATCNFYMYLVDVLDENSFRLMMKNLNSYNEFISNLIKKTSNIGGGVIDKVGNIVLEIIGPRLI